MGKEERHKLKMVVFRVLLPILVIALSIMVPPSEQFSLFVLRCLVLDVVGLAILEIEENFNNPRVRFDVFEIRFFL